MDQEKPQEVGENEFRISCRRVPVVAVPSRSSGARFSEGTGYAKPSPDKLAFVFDTGDDSVIHTTFAYDRESGAWHWIMDIDRSGKLSNFAKVSLTRQ